jgi:hypothetical protein
MTFISNPTVTDVTQISVNMADLETLGMTVAVALMGLLIPLEFLRQNLNIIEGKSTYSATFVRIFVVCMGLMLYKTVFNCLVGVGVIVEDSILSIPKWGEFLTELAKFYLNYKPSFFRSLLPILFAWTASFLALVVNAVIYWVRYALLSLLYFVGPISFVFYIFEPTKNFLGAWFKNVMQLSLWTVVLKLIVRIMLSLQVQTFMAQANMDQDVITIIGINVTFLVMVIASPLFTAELIGKQTIGPMADVAASFFSAPGKVLAKTIPGSPPLALGRMGYRYYKVKREGTNTEARNKLSHGNGGGSNSNLPTQRISR